MASIVLMANFVQSLFGILMFLTGLFLILLVLIQRGRGGGLAGALGGMGGQSAFGSKAGDTFTKVTIVVASCWITLCLLAVWFLGKPAPGPLDGTVSPSSTSAETSTTETAPGSDAADTPQASTTDQPAPSVPPAAGNQESSPAEISREDQQLDLGPPTNEQESETGPTAKEEPGP